jgi:hypothetical protein
MSAFQWGSELTSSMQELTSSMQERLGPRSESLFFQSRGALSLVCMEPAITWRHYLQQAPARSVMQGAAAFTMTQIVNVHRYTTVHYSKVCSDFNRDVFIRPVGNAERSSIHNDTNR